MGFREILRGFQMAAWTTVLTLTGAGAGHAGTVEIAIVTSRDIAPYRAAYQGFLEVLDRAEMRGHKVRRDISCRVPDEAFRCCSP